MFLITTQPEKDGSIITLKNDITKAYAEILTFGAILNGFGFLEEKGINCIDGYENNAAAIAEKNTWFKSCFLSPFVCRLNKGNYKINETPYSINKFYLDKHAIHGLVYDLNYEVIEQIETEDFCKVILQANYKADNAEFPFNYLIQQEFKLDKTGLTTTSCITNQSKEAMPYAQGWHPYFSLGNSVDDCILQLTSTKMLEFDDELIPTKKFLDNTTFLSFTSLKNKNLDACFMLENTKQAILKNSNFSFTINALKGYNFFQVFTPNHRKTIALEVLSGAPDCFNNGLGLLHIAPNQTIEFVVNYCLEKTK